MRLSGIYSFLTDFIKFGVRAVTIGITFTSVFTYATESDNSETYGKLATPEKLSAIESYLLTGMDEYQIPGLSIGIVEKGEVIYLKSFGKQAANREINDKNIQNTTAFKLGSVSKTFTSLAIMRLQASGKLNISDPIINYIPWFRTLDKSNSDRITIKQLLNHTSGISTVSGNRNQQSTQKERISIEKSVRELESIELVNEPGMVFEYSNANYQVLGYLIEKVSKQSYADYIRENIFIPLEMPNSFFQEEKHYLNNAATGHLYWLGSPTEKTDELGPVTTAQGGIYSSSQDMMNYLKMMMNSDNSIISEETKREMLVPEKLMGSYGYGLGWYYDKFDSFTVSSHFGQSAGFETVISFSNELGVGWFVAVNASSAFGEVSIAPFIGRIGAILNGKPADLYGVSTVEKLLFWFTLVIPPLVVIFIWLLRNKINKNSQYLNFRKWTKANLLIRAVIPAIFSLVIPWFLLVLLPSSYGAPLSAVAFFQPTIFCLMLASSTAVIVWLLIRVVLMARFKIPGFVGSSAG